MPITVTFSDQQSYDMVIQALELQKSIWIMRIEVLTTGPFAARNGELSYAQSHLDAICRAENALRNKYQTSIKT